MKTPTPKQTVEAIKEILIAWLIGLGYTIPPFNGKHSQEMFRQIMALLNPVEKKEKCSCSCHIKIGASVKELKKVKGNSCRHCVMFVSSPNEAPKGEACECDCHKVVESMNKKRQGWESNCGFCGHRSKPQPPAPDKEWEEKLKNGKIVEINGKKYFKPFSGYTVTLNYFIRSLILSKDQEADRRVREAIGEEQKRIKKVFKSYCLVNRFGECKYWKRNDKNESGADNKFFPEELLNKLSPQKGGKKLSSK